jgi:hypothetical protein
MIRPNFFIAGAPKAGTSSLHAYLHSVPGIFMSRIKEPNYFSRVVVPDDHPVRPIRDTDSYLRLFAAAGDAKVVGESSPTYLADPEAPALMDQFAPSCRVLVSLRDPVERAYSHYLMLRNNGMATGSFADELKRGLRQKEQRNIILLRPDVGLYFEQVRRHLDVFGNSRLHVVLFEEFMKDVPGSLSGITRFLGIEHDFSKFKAPAYRQFAEVRGPVVRYLFGNRTVSRVSETLIPPKARRWIRETFLMRKAGKPEMDAESRRFLTDFYRDDVAKLAALLERPLPWRNFTARNGA